MLKAIRQTVRRRIEWRILNGFFDWMQPGSFTEAMRNQAYVYTQRNSFNRESWRTFPDLTGHTKDW